MCQRMWKETIFQEVCQICTVNFVSDAFWATPTPLSICSHSMMRLNLLNPGIVWISEEVDSVAQCCPRWPIFLPSMGKHHHKAVFPHGINMAAAVPSLKSTQHINQERVLFFSSVLMKAMVAMSKLTGVRLTGAADWLKHVETHPWNSELDQLLQRYFICPSHSFLFLVYPITPGQALSRHAWLRENSSAERRDVSSPFALFSLT